MGCANYADLPLVLTVEQVSEILCIGRNTAYEIVRAGKIRSIRIGHQIRIPRESLAEYLGVCV